MILENLLKGMTIPGVVPENRLDNQTKQLSVDEKALFIIQNLIGEISRLQKLLAKRKGVTLSAEVIGVMDSIEQSTIAKAWGVSRHAFAQMIEKLQVTGMSRRKSGSGATISVMTDAVKRKLVQILVQNEGDIDFNTWEEEIAKDKRFKATPKRESIRRW